MASKNIPKLAKMTDLRIKNLQRASDALPIRILLLDFYVNQECTLEELYEIV